MPHQAVATSWVGVRAEPEGRARLFLVERKRRKKNLDGSLEWKGACEPTWHATEREALAQDSRQELSR